VTTLPQANATLIAVNGQGANAETFDGPAGEGPLKWDGRAPAYYREQRDRKRTEAGEDREVRRELIVSTLLGIDFRSGDYVTFDPPTGTEITATVQLVEARKLDGIPEALQTTRLTLEPA